MRVRAIAIASEHSNTVGTVEIECTAQGLAITYIDAARVGDEGVPVPFEQGQRVSVDWSSVRHARHIGSALALEFELPHGGAQRCLLVHFSTGHDVTLQEVQHRRLLLRLWTLGLSVVLASALALAAPRLSPSIGPISGLTAGFVFAVILILIGVKAERFLADGGRRSKVLGELFVSDLLAFLPNIPVGPLEVSAKRFNFPRFDGIVPRTTLAISLTLADALLAALIMFRWIITPHDDSLERNVPEFASPAPPTFSENSERSPVPASTPISTAIELPVSPVPAKSAPVASLPIAGVARVAGPCECKRADSLLWGQPLPRVSLVVLSSHRYKRREHEHVEVEFAAINNSDHEIAELTSMAEFFQ